MADHDCVRTYTLRAEDDTALYRFSHNLRQGPILPMTKYNSPLANMVKYEGLAERWFMTEIQYNSF